jgi:hypothetical protein
MTDDTNSALYRVKTRVPEFEGHRDVMRSCSAGRPMRRHSRPSQRYID